MDKLDTHHLTPYLPYGVNFLTVFDKQTPKLLTGICGNIIYYEDHEKWIAVDAIKPILRPLSDLDINHLPDIEPKHQSPAVVFTDGYIELCYWSEYEYLFANHFDVFGLIPAGLAISYNSIQKGENT